MWFADAWRGSLRSIRQRRGLLSDAGLWLALLGIAGGLAIYLLAKLALATMPTVEESTPVVARVTLKSGRVFVCDRGAVTWSDHVVCRRTGNRDALRFPWSEIADFSEDSGAR